MLLDEQAQPFTALYPWRPLSAFSHMRKGLGTGWAIGMTTLLEPGFVREAEAEQAALSPRKRFAVMDGLRGVAALVVVLFHSFDGGSIVPNGQLVVDLFFILSGFVIGYSYDDRLSSPGERGRFLLSRFIRLYPMLFIGALGGLAFGLIHSVTNPSEGCGLKEVMSSGGLSFLVLPYLGESCASQAFSFNPPIWSLFFEIVANLAYALFARRLSIGVLLALTIVGVTAVVIVGPLGGAYRADFLAGTPRVIAGFFGGLLLYKLWRADYLPKLAAGILPLSLAVLLVVGFPIPIAGWIYLPTFVALMAVVALAANSHPAKTDGWCEFLGLVSYPIYLTHWLTLYAFTFIGVKMGLTGGLYTAVALVHLAVTPAIGFLIARFYETPARLFLTQCLKLRRRTAG